MSFHGIEAVLFDLDGTLLDTAPDLAAAANRLLQARGLPALPVQAYRPHAGAGARGLLGVAFGITPGDPSFEALREEFFASYEQGLLIHTQPFEEVQALIDALQSRRLAWGVVTNKSQRFALPLTQQLALFSTAGTVVCGDTTPHAKPHPAPLLEAARQLGVAPAQCVYVGDDERDVMAGRAAGMATVAATYGYLHEPAAAQRWGADASIDAPLALLACLE